MKLFLKPVWTLVIAFVALFMSFQASAATIAIDAGSFKFTGDTYIDATLPGETRAMGRVTTISQGADIIWSSGDSGTFMSFTSGGITPVITPTAPLFNFVGNGGYLNFFTHATDVVNTSLNWLAMDNLITAGDLYLSTAIFQDVIGIATNVSYSANGFLNVTGGSSGAIFDTNSRETFTPGVYSDLTFGIVGADNDNQLVHSDYSYITSADVQGSVVTPIPEPAILLLTGVGVLMLVSSRNKRYSDVGAGSAA